MKISVHQLINDVDIVEVLPPGWAYDVLYRNNLQKKKRVDMHAVTSHQKYDYYTESLYNTS